MESSWTFSLILRSIILLALPSKYTRNLTASYNFYCYHPNSGPHHPLPGSWLSPPDGTSCLFPLLPLVYSQCWLNISKITSLQYDNSPMSPMSLQVKAKVLTMTLRPYTIFSPPPPDIGVALSLSLSHFTHPHFVLLSLTHQTQSHLRAFVLAALSLENTPVLGA